MAAQFKTLLVVVFMVSASSAVKITDENEAWRWLTEYSEKASVISNEGSKISWKYATNITDENERRQVEFSEVEKQFTIEVALNASKFDFESFSNATLKKEFKSLANRGAAALPSAEFTEYVELSLELESIYGKATICKEKDKELALEPELTETLASSRNHDELLWIWKSWRDATGAKMREKYIRFIKLQNKAATLNGYADKGEVWREGYDLEGYDFRADIERLYIELKPFYKELHTYVKNKLKNFYGADKFPSTGHIPAHLLGNMWAQTWGNVEDLVQPFNSSNPVNATPAITRLTVKDMFNISDEFFTSLGLEPVTQEFWDNSMLEKPIDGRKVVCHASAWDFNDGKDFRIKQCTRKNMEDFITVHHEMGHIQYYLQYKDQLYPFRGGANPGFHEAVGDVLALSVATPEHLKKVNLIDSFESTNDSNINYMMSIALDKIVFLPFGKLMDDYRWAVFDGSVTSDNLNSEWWKRRCSYQGLSPPVTRSENDFDPGAKYHIPANVPYVRYFVSYVLQFQFHKALCQAANHVGPLHTCDIYQSKNAGAKLRNMLRMGASKDWTEALEAITGNKTMSAAPLIEYFQPLMDYLVQHNSQYSNDNTWTDECPSPSNLPEASTIKSGTCEKPVVASAPYLQTSAIIKVMLIFTAIYEILNI